MAKSYFPELQLKDKRTKLKENRLWARKYGEPNTFYTLYGLDVVGSNQENFMDYYHFMTSRNRINRIGQLDCQVCLLRDKLIFYKYMKANGLPVPEVFAVLRNQKLYDINMNEIQLASLSHKEDYFIKSIDGECASFVKHVDNFTEFLRLYDELLKTTDYGTYILQERVEQSEEMSKINPNSLNTYRIVTINKDNSTYLLTGILRVGTQKSGNVDNWAAGGLAIGIKDNGFLKKYGYFKPEHGLKVDRHPDTGVIFSNFNAPQYKEAIELALKAHKFFYGVKAIGWDIAIGVNGPIFIEGNDNWEISLNQACDRPLRKDWEDVLL